MYPLAIVFLVIYLQIVKLTKSRKQNNESLCSISTDKIPPATQLQKIIQLIAFLQFTHPKIFLCFEGWLIIVFKERHFLTHICNMHTKQNTRGHGQWLCLQMCHEQHTTFASLYFASDYHKRCKTHCHKWWVSKLFWEELNCTGAGVLLSFCCTVVGSFPGARYTRHIPLTLQIKAMRNSKWNSDIVSWQSLPGLSWRFHLENDLGDHSLLWECERTGTGNETVNNSSEEPKLFSTDLSSARNSGSLTPFLKIQLSKMRVLQVYQSDTG